MCALKRIAIATTGGDAPGMNACVRAVVKGCGPDNEIIGVRNGALGLLRGSEEFGDYFRLHKQSVSNIINRSGTVLKSTRQARFRDYVLDHAPGLSESEHGDLTFDDRFGAVIGKLAADSLGKNQIDALILVGGDTTCRAAIRVHEAVDKAIPVVVVPATIDNDIRGTVQTIGFDSAVAMATAQVDAIRETAASMDRIFLVEVMGHSQGHIAVEVALATGAEQVLIPEQRLTIGHLETLAERLARRAEQDRESSIVIVAEGTAVPVAEGVERLPTPSQQLDQYIRRVSQSVEVRTSVLGHTLRGAPPTAFTRNLATRSGLKALEEIADQWEKQPNQRRDTPSLIGVHRDGFPERVDVVGSMIRDESLALVKAAMDQNERLSF